MVRRKDKYQGESIKEISSRAVARARQTKCLHPHELLRYWANGVAIAGVSPDAEMQVQCAIAAAPYFAPKLQAIESKTETTVRAVIAASPVSVSDWVERYSLPSPAIEVPPLSHAVTEPDNIVSVEVEEAELITETDTL